jgi:hypothetical protein
MGIPCTWAKWVTLLSSKCWDSHWIEESLLRTLVPDPHSNMISCKCHNVPQYNND